MVPRSTVSRGSYGGSLDNNNHENAKGEFMSTTLILSTLLAPSPFFYGYTMFPSILSFQPASCMHSMIAAPHSLRVVAPDHVDCCTCIIIIDAGFF